jgi:hypothetical protein
MGIPEREVSLPQLAESEGPPMNMLGEEVFPGMGEDFFTGDKEYVPEDAQSQSKEYCDRQKIGTDLSQENLPESSRIFEGNSTQGESTPSMTMIIMENGEGFNAAATPSLPGRVVVSREAAISRIKNGLTSFQNFTCS